MARILMASVPLTGHVLPGLPIARALVARGNEVWWYTGRRFADRIAATGAQYVPMKAAFDYNDQEIDRVFPGRTALKGVAQLKFDLKHVFADAAPDQVKDLMELLTVIQPDALVADAAFTGATILREMTGFPVALYGIVPLMISSRDTAPFGLALPPAASRLGRLRNRALNALVGGLVFRDVNAHANMVRAELGLPPTSRLVFDTVLDADLYLHASDPAFEYPRSDLPENVRFIGPFLPAPTTGYEEPAWWREMTAHARPVVHVTQGTLATDFRQLVQPALRALADENVLVTASNGGKPVESLGIDPLPANARVESYIPHDRLLPHVDVMITNGGFGGVQVALANGVPLVVAGASEDKPEVAARVAWAGAGINLKTATPTEEQIRRALRAILGSTRYLERARALQAALTAHDAPTKAASLIEGLAMRHVVAAQVAVSRAREGVTAPVC